jgi:ATP-dependent Zn protease
MADYSVAIHESGHAVAASLLDVADWHAVTTNAGNDGSLGRMIRDHDEHLKLALRTKDDSEANWAASAWAITALAGPVAEARWIEGEYAERIDIGRLEDFGGRHDLSGARVVAEAWEIPITNILGHAIELVHTDRVWLAIERVADALVERRTLLSTEVDRLVGKKAKGAGQW